MTRTSNIMFNKSRESRHPFLASNLRGKAFSFSLLRMMSTLCLSWKVKVLVAQLCLNLCDPMDCSLTGSFVHGILQARILGWVAIPFLRGIFMIQGSNLDHLHCRQILYCLSHKGGLCLSYMAFNILRYVHFCLLAFLQWKRRCSQSCNCNPMSGAEASWHAGARRWSPVVPNWLWDQKVLITCDAFIFFLKITNFQLNKV